MSRLRSIQKSYDHAAAQSDGMAELKVAIPAPLLAVLDRYAHTHGVSRAQAVSLLLHSAPWVSEHMASGVSLRDVVGP
jgi:hypothetical protein